MSDNHGMEEVGQEDNKVVEQATEEVIRQALLKATLEIGEKADANGIFANAHSFVKIMSQGNITVRQVILYLYDDYLLDYETCQVVLGGGLCNLKALQVLTIRSEDRFRAEGGYDGDEEGSMRPLYWQPVLTTRLEDGIRTEGDYDCNKGEEDVMGPLYWQAFANALCRVRQKIDLRLDGGSSWFENKVNRFTHAIQGIRTIWSFNSGHVIYWDDIHELLSALASLPSLEIVTIGHYPFQGDADDAFESPESLTKLLKLPSLRSIEFSCFRFTADLCQALLAAFNEGSFVTDLWLTDCFLGHDGDQYGRSRGILHALQRNTKLESLHLVGNKFDSLFYEAMATVLLVNTTLKDLTLHITLDHLQFAEEWLQPLLVAMRINTSLKSLNVNYFRLSEVSVTSALQVMLAENSSLEELTLHFDGSVRDTGVASWHNTLPFFRDNKTLKSLTIVFDEEAIDIDAHVVATLCIDTVAMLEGNSSLECLEIQNTNINPDKYFTAVSKLQSNTTLRTLRLHPNLHSICDDKIIKQVSSVTSLVKKNCSLELLDEGLYAYDPKRELGALLRLNKAGRRYLLEDAPSVSAVKLQDGEFPVLDEFSEKFVEKTVKGIKVLSDVSDDLDCVFLHLLENPLLCDISCRDIEAETDAHRKKRQRSPN